MLSPGAMSSVNSSQSSCMNILFLGFGPAVPAAADSDLFCSELHHTWMRNSRGVRTRNKWRGFV